MGTTPGLDAWGGLAIRSNLLDLLDCQGLINERHVRSSGGSMEIDTSFDFRTDAGGRDPDKYSPTLRRYHRFLWSKILPAGRSFELTVNHPEEYLCHQSVLGTYFLSSDSAIATFIGHERSRHIISQVAPHELEVFQRVGYTIGGMMVFPSNRVDSKPTINGARGMNSKISDRLDLTLECIRRHYKGEPSPLAATLDGYRDFFALFDDFPGLCGVLPSR